MLRMTVEKLDQRLREDTRLESKAGQMVPRDHYFTVRVVEWVKKLETSPSDALILAAWGHVMDRWTLPRDTYPKTTGGYHQWRRAQAKMSAEKTAELLKNDGWTDDIVGKVKELILKKNFPQDPESQVLEDAMCLAFLEIKLDEYLPDWDEEKTIRILKMTLEKMTPRAQELAGKVAYSPGAMRVIGKAIA